MINIKSEIGKLKKVVLHRPGKELDNLTPETLEELLFDDIPWLSEAQKEHDAFADTLRKAGVEVLYLADLAAEVMNDTKIKEQFVDQFIKEANIATAQLEKKIKELFLSLDSKEMILKSMEGVRKGDLPSVKKEELADWFADNEVVCNPMPNLYFTRDPFAFMGDGVSVNSMKFETRTRETIYGDYIFKYHKDFKNSPRYSDRFDVPSIEGGDILILKENVLAIGVSQRTSPNAIQELAKHLLPSDTNSFDTILAFDIPNERAFMHLDTVFTQVDHDKFTIYGGIQGTLRVFELKMNGSKVAITEKEDKLEKILEHYLGKKITLIKCGGNDIIAGAREQWNDGANTLAIAPGEVVVYSRNEVSNAELEKAGLKLHIVPSHELSRGRGGPRCMSMPVYREDIK